MSGKGGKTRKKAGVGQAPEAEPFFGRRAELDAMHEQLKDPKGKAVLVVGPAGIGKSSLVRRFIYEAEAKDHKKLKCRAVTYGMTPDEQAELMLSRLISEAEAALRGSSGFFSVTDHGKRQLAALFKLVPQGSEILDLIETLKSKQVRHPRQEFIQVLEVLSQRLGDKARAVFFIDADRKMPPDCADTWRLIVQGLPEKIMLIFAQQPDDALASSNEFLALPNVCRIPSTDLHKLNQAETDDMLDWASQETDLARGVIRKAFARYDGHPYAIAAAVGLLLDGLPIGELPTDPTPRRIAVAQWERIKGEHGPDAMRLFKAHALLEVPANNAVVRAVGELDIDRHDSLLANRFLASLLRPEGDSRTIYHAILCETIVEAIDDESSKGYHRRAAEVYRAMLAAAKQGQFAPAPTAAMCAFQHVRKSDGVELAAVIFVNECASPLMSLGMLQFVEDFTYAILPEVEHDDISTAALLGNLGVTLFCMGKFDLAENALRGAIKVNRRLCRTKSVSRNCNNLGVLLREMGNLVGAEEMHFAALGASRESDWLEGVSGSYSNIGVVRFIRGDLDGAEEMHRMSLGIEEQCGRLSGVAIALSNIGSVLRSRGDYGGAESMYRKALEIENRLGRAEGIANAYGNIGTVLQLRGRFHDARQMHLLALEINQRDKRLAGVADNYVNIGFLEQSIGNFEAAEDSYGKALRIETHLGRPEPISVCYANLSIVKRCLGDLDAADEMCDKAMAIDQKTGRKEGIAHNLLNRGSILCARGEYVSARQTLIKSRELFAELGANHMVDRVQGMLDQLPD